LTRMVHPEEEAFSGFTFKIQANMDPAHRDRIAFFRICSGTFTRGMKVMHHRLGKEINLSNATVFMAQSRSHVDEAYPGDIIGIHNHGTIKIGDTFTDKEELKFTGIPNFAPEHFRRVVLRNPLKMKQLQKGLLQMAEEGAVQVFRPIVGNEYILGAVGVLQFEVTMTRLKDEYGVEATYEPLSYTLARWVSSDNKQQLREFEKKHQFNLALDAEGHLSYLAEGSWRLAHTQELFPRSCSTKPESPCEVAVAATDVLATVAYRNHTRPVILLIAPPVAKPGEPPAGIAMLAGSLRRHGVPCTLLDANLEGLLFLLGQAENPGDTWSTRALRHRDANLAALRTPARYQNTDQYQRAVRDTNRVLEVAVRSRPELNVSLSNYQDTGFNPLDSRDLLKAAEQYESSLFFPWFRMRLPALLES
jgi:hypothetical protein